MTAIAIANSDARRGRVGRKLSFAACARVTMPSRHGAGTRAYIAHAPSAIPRGRDPPEPLTSFCHLREMNLPAECLLDEIKGIDEYTHADEPAAFESSELRRT